MADSLLKQLKVRALVKQTLILTPAIREKPGWPEGRDVEVRLAAESRLGRARGPSAPP